MGISTFDIIVLAVYLIGITAFGIWIGFRRHASTDQYFLANKSLGWFTVGAAVFTSNISTIHLVGLAAGGAKDGMVIGNFEWMACFTLILLAMLWSTQGDQFGTIFEAINKIPMTFAPAVTTVFVLGVLWKRGTKQAAMATLYAGSVIGVIYFLFDLPSVGKLILAGKAHEGFGGLVTDPTQGLGIPFMLVGPLIAVLCVAIYIITSLLTPAMDPKEVSQVCWDHPLAFLKGRFAGASDPRLVTLILLAVVGVLYFLLR